MATNKGAGEAQALAIPTKSNSQLPAHLQGQTKQNKIGNIDKSDLIIPRVKLLQALSPEVVEEVEGAKVGLFWHSSGEPMGSALRGIPIVLRKTYVLWAPRTDDRGILARASDGKNWDVPNMTFEFKPKGSSKIVKYELGAQVGPDIGLGKFGTMIPDDPQSMPAANLTYEVLWYFPDFDKTAIILNTRSAVRPCKDLLSKIDDAPVDHYNLEFIIKSVDQKGADGPFKNYKYDRNGYADEEHTKLTAAIWEKYKDLAWRADDETEEADAAGGEGATKRTVADDGATTGSKRF